MMKQNKFLALKNMIWAVGIAVCLAFVIIGLLFAMFHKYTGGEENFNTSLGAGLSSASEEKTVDLSSDALGSGVSRGELYLLERTDDAGDAYLGTITFLIDSTYIGLRDLNLVGTNQVWATNSGSLKIDSLPSAVIKFPNDGSEISPVSAAMIVKPQVLVIAIGMDGLANVDENTFITNYDNMINDIKSASPDTKVICCGLPSVIAGYSGGDGLNVGRVSDGNDWVQFVCRDTGSYFLNAQEELSESVQLLSRFASANGKTLNRKGLDAFLGYLTTHAIP